MNHVIVVPVHNALPSLKALLTSLNDVSLSAPLILIDDASDLETMNYIVDYSRWRPGVTQTKTIRNRRQQLFTRTVNRGLRMAVDQFDPDLVTVINTDCVVSRGWDTQLLNAFNDRRVGMVGYWDNNYPNVDLTTQPYTEMKAPGYVTGHCFTLRVEMLREIGILCETDIDGRCDPTLAPFHGQAHIGSERLLCNKANMYGWKSLYVNAPLVQHGEGKSWGRDLRWLSEFILEPLWQASDELGVIKFID